MEIKQSLKTKRKSDRPLADVDNNLPPWRQVLDAAINRFEEENAERRQDRSRQREEEIISAAIRVFARLGVAKTRISDIAAEAGVPAPSLYGYYESKEELAYAIPIKRQVQFFAEYARQSEKFDTVHCLLYHFLWLTADFARRHPDWAGVLYLEVWPSVLIKEARVRSVVDDYARIVVGLIRDGSDRGEWPEDPDPYQTATIFIGALSQLIITWLLYREPRDLLRSVKPMLERLMTLLNPYTTSSAKPHETTSGKTAALSTKRKKRA
ncbi:MAG: TetR/AcrR family transcriptional regulator [Xanthobacteraceae bacterium]